MQEATKWLIVKFRIVEKLLVTASSPMAIGFTHFVYYIPKNSKLATARRSTALMLRITTLFPTLQTPSSWLLLYEFHLYGTSFSTLTSADATK